MYQISFIYMVFNSQDINSNRYDYIMQLKLFFVNDFYANSSSLMPNANYTIFLNNSIA